MHAATTYCTMKVRDVLKAAGNSVAKRTQLRIDISKRRAGCQDRWTMGCMAVALSSGPGSFSVISLRKKGQRSIMDGRETVTVRLDNNDRTTMSRKTEWDFPQRRMSS